MRLSKALNDKVMDVRLRDKLVSEGSLNKGEVEKYLTDLPDDNANLAYTDDGVKEKVSEETVSATEPQI